MGMAGSNVGIISQRAWPGRLVGMHFDEGFPGGGGQNSRTQHHCLPIFMIRRRRTPISLGRSSLKDSHAKSHAVVGHGPLLRALSAQAEVCSAVDWLESVGLSALVDKSRSLDAVLRRRAAMFACRGVRDGQHGEIDWSTPPNKDGAPMEPGCKSSSGI